MSSSVNLQAVVLRLRAALVAAQSQNNSHQLIALMNNLDLLVDVACAANNSQIAALLEAMLDAARDIVHGVTWKSDIPSVSVIVATIPASTASAAGTTTQASLLHNFLVRVVIAWAQMIYATDKVQVTLDDQIYTTIYGANTFAWAANVQTGQLLNSFPIEIALDIDGCMSVNHIST